jgi:hypothetical protein
MNHSNFTQRLAAAVASIVLTLGLFQWVASLGDHAQAEVLARTFSTKPALAHGGGQ